MADLQAAQAPAAPKVATTEEITSWRLDLEHRFAESAVRFRSMLGMERRAPKDDEHKIAEEVRRQMLLRHEANELGDAASKRAAIEPTTENIAQKKAISTLRFGIYNYGIALENEDDKLDSVARRLPVWKALAERFSEASVPRNNFQTLNVAGFLTGIVSLSFRDQLFGLLTQILPHGGPFSELTMAGTVLGFGTNIASGGLLIARGIRQSLSIDRIKDGARALFGLSPTIDRKQK